MTINQTTGRRTRVVMLAYLCSPYRGSEYAVGWNRAVLSAQHQDTWVLTGDHDDARSDIEHYWQQRGGIDALRFIYVPGTAWQNRLKRLPGMYYFAYRLWHRQALRVAQDLHQRFQFALAHQVNYCGYREPGYLWKLGIPFIWGPVGGTQNYPWRMLSQADLYGGAREALRSVLNCWQLRFSPHVRAAVLHCDRLLCANTTNLRDFQLAHGVQPQLMLETGLHRAAESPRKYPDQLESLKILWSGDFETHKALPLLIESLAMLPAETRCEVRILGRGRLEKSWRRLAERRGVADRLQWLGWLPHDEAKAQCRWADVLAFTSLRDTSGNVVLEALADGLPVVCLDHQGVRDIVTDDCGVRIPVTSPRRVARDMAAVLTRLLQQPEELSRLSRGAIRRAQHYCWQQQGRRMQKVYQEVLAQRADRAATGMSAERGDSARPGSTDVCSDPAAGRIGREQLKDWTKRLSGTTGAILHRLLGSRAGDAIGILVYHRVADSPPGVPTATMNVTPAQFRAQLTGLLDLGFNFWPLERILACGQVGQAIPPRTVVLTFDDVFENVYQNAWPVMRDLQIPSTMFVSTKFLDSHDHFPFDGWARRWQCRLAPELYRPLSRSQCHEMLSSQLVEIGCHTHSHQDFQRQVRPFMQDVGQSLVTLRSEFGLQHPSFAFPFGRRSLGQVTDAMLSALRMSGEVSCALTTECELVDPHADPFGWGRFNVYQWDTPASLAGKLAGWYSWAPGLQNLVRRVRRPVLAEEAARGRSGSCDGTRNGCEAESDERETAEASEQVAEPV